MKYPVANSTEIQYIETMQRDVAHELKQLKLQQCVEYVGSGLFIVCSVSLILFYGAWLQEQSFVLHVCGAGLILSQVCKWIATICNTQKMISLTIQMTHFWTLRLDLTKTVHDAVESWSHTHFKAHKESEGLISLAQAIAQDAETFTRELIRARELVFHAMTQINTHGGFSEFAKMTDLSVSLAAVINMGLTEVQSLDIEKLRKARQTLDIAITQLQLKTTN